MTIDNSVELDSFFTDTDPTRRVKGAQAPVLVLMDAKGGVGTSTLSLCAAELAATAGGVKRVTVVDACQDTGDLRLMMRTAERLPTVHTAALRRDPRLATIGPDRLNGARPAHVPTVGFGMILAPGHGQASASTPHDYAQAIRAVREVSDLVIVDAGSVAPAANSKMAEILLVPMLRSGFWSLVVADSTQAGVRNALALMNSLSALDVPRDRTMSVINKVRPSIGTEGADRMSEAMTKLSIPVGWIEHDDKEIGDRMELGTIPHDHPQIAVALSKVLLRVTGRGAFEPVANATIDRKGRVREAAPVASAASAADAKSRTKMKLPSFGKK